MDDTFFGLHLVSVTDDYTGAKIEELANTLYILAVDGHNDTSGNGDGQPSVTIERPLIAAALKEFQVELKARVGFHAMTATKGETNVRNPR